MTISIISKWRGISFNDKLSIGKRRIKFRFRNHENVNALIILVNMWNLFLIELTFICPIKTVDIFRRAFFQTAKASILLSSFSELCGIIFLELFFCFVNWFGIKSVIWICKWLSKSPYCSNEIYR